MCHGWVSCLGIMWLKSRCWLDGVLAWRLWKVICSRATQVVAESSPLQLQDWGPCLLAVSQQLEAALRPFLQSPLHLQASSKGTRQSSWCFRSSQMTLPEPSRERTLLLKDSCGYVRPAQIISTPLGWLISNLNHICKIPFPCKVSM